MPYYTILLELQVLEPSHQQYDLRKYFIPLSLSLLTHKME